MIEFWGTYPKKPKKADLHIHTKGSDGIMTHTQAVDNAIKNGFSIIAITDHEIIHAAQKAQKYCEDLGNPLEVIVGSEITTKWGQHVIGYDLIREIPSGKPLEETIKEIHGQGGLVIAPHPLLGFLGMEFLGSLGKNKIFSIMDNPDKDVYFDGFEIYNRAIYNIYFHRSNIAARAFYQQYGDRLGAAVAGSDLHCGELGGVETCYKGDFREALQQKQTCIRFREKRDHFKPVEVIQQFYASMVLEPYRKAGRLIKRHEKL